MAAVYPNTLEECATIDVGWNIIDMISMETVAVYQILGTHGVYDFTIENSLFDGLSFMELLMVARGSLPNNIDSVRTILLWDVPF